MIVKNHGLMHNFQQYNGILKGQNAAGRNVDCNYCTTFVSICMSKYSIQVGMSEKTCY
jgi:hypothetical protein